MPGAALHAAIHLRREIGYRKAYLRAAQAYMLISMPTDTSTIFGVFQAIADLLLLGTIFSHDIS